MLGNNLAVEDQSLLVLLTFCCPFLHGFTLREEVLHLAMDVKNTASTIVLLSSLRDDKACYKLLNLSEDALETSFSVMIVLP